MRTKSVVCLRFGFFNYSYKARVHMSIVEDSPILSPTFGRRMTSTYAVTTSVLIFAAASAPTPLYRLYEASWGLSAFTVTVIFAAYAAGFLAALLTVGSLSGFVGRKPVFFCILTRECNSNVFFSERARRAHVDFRARSSRDSHRQCRQHVGRNHC